MTVVAEKCPIKTCIPSFFYLLFISDYIHSIQSVRENMSIGYWLSLFLFVLINGKGSCGMPWKGEEEKDGSGNVSHISRGSEINYIMVGV